MDDWDFPHYACPHGIRAGHEFRHLLGPTTTADGSAPVAPCVPVLVGAPPISSTEEQR